MYSSTAWYSAIKIKNRGWYVDRFDNLPTSVRPIHQWSIPEVLWYTAATSCKNSACLKIYFSSTLYIHRMHATFYRMSENPGENLSENKTHTNQLIMASGLIQSIFTLFLCQSGMPFKQCYCLSANRVRVPAMRKYDRSFSIWTY